jgi:hypothetical protein
MLEDNKNVILGTFDQTEGALSDLAPVRNMDRNSATVWLPAVEQSGANFPRTIMIEYDHNDIIRFQDGEYPQTMHDLFAKMVAACEKIGWPCFIRTDLASAKHDGPSSYLAKGFTSLRNCIAATAAG